MSNRLYMVVDDYDETDWSETVALDERRLDEWREFCLERWGEEREFFLPKSGGVYKSRSAAINRAELINHWGGRAKVLECTPVWVTLEDAKRHREAQRLRARIAEKLDELNHLEDELAEVEG